VIVDDHESAMSFSPDGLTEQVIDALLREVNAAVAGPRATSTLQAGTVVRPVRGVPPLFADRDAALRRERRRANRALARVARSLPLVVADGEQAA
jgi:hypothetical protein